MDEIFELPVYFNDQTLLLPAQLQAWGYSHRILVTINNQIVTFEPDEERNYRAISSNSEKIPDVQFVQAVVATIESLFK